MLLRGIVTVTCAIFAMILGVHHLSNTDAAEEHLAELKLFEMLFSETARPLPRANPLEQGDLVRWGCRVDLMTERMQLSLSLAETVVSRGNDGGSDTTASNSVLMSADNTVRSLLACNPTLGEAWFRLALLERFAEGWSPISASLVGQAQTYAPLEGALMRRRLNVLQNLPALPAELATKLEGLAEQDRQVLERLQTNR